MENGDPGLPGAGRKKNLFKAHIREIGEKEGEWMEFEGEIMEKGKPTGEKAWFRLKMPAAMAVVVKMYKMAQKGDVSAAKWLSETAYGKNVKLGEDEENPLGGGFAVILPANSR